MVTSIYLARSQQSIDPVEQGLVEHKYKQDVRGLVLGTADFDRHWRQTCKLAITPLSAVLSLGNPVRAENSSLSRETNSVAP